MRLIDADVAVENIEEWLNSVGTVLIRNGLSCTCELMGCIEDAPTIDAVPVVRCGQCKFDNLCCRNVGKDGKRTKDDFCSYGEWKEGAENG